MHVPQQLFHSLVLPSSTPLSDQHLQPFVNKDFLPLSPARPPPPRSRHPSSGLHGPSQPLSSPTALIRIHQMYFAVTKCLIEP